MALLWTGVHQAAACMHVVRQIPATAARTAAGACPAQRSATDAVPVTVITHGSLLTATGVVVCTHTAILHID